MPRLQQHVLFAGHVQGVSFRARTLRIARQFEVSGFVRNLVDGRVELVAEGEKAQVESFVAAVRDQLRDHIRDLTVELRAATDQYPTFEIRT